MKEWGLLIVAAIFEVGWVIGLKHASSVVEWGWTVVAILISFGLLIRSGKYLPVGTAYAVFVGLGTVGTVIMDTVLFGQPLGWAQVVLIGLLLAGIIGLKQTTKGAEV
ncbi:DMT family transporter [Chryseomicrobium palamuruense]|uniref:DMT family transporter n=1 Tax=Chryseomicrobium palamuruense TaxID=682973 RepID=A0ABV8UVU6_9BACL